MTAHHQSVAHGTGDSLARLAHVRGLEEKALPEAREAIDPVAIRLLGDVGDATEKLQLWNELRCDPDTERLWRLLTSEHDEDDLDELTDADWMRHSFATHDHELAHRWGATVSRLIGEIEGCIDRHRYMHAERTRPARTAVA